MNATSKILAKQFSEMPRMQDCLLTQNERYLTPAEVNSMFFHFLEFDLDCCHWVLSHLKDEVIYLYDSLLLPMKDKLKRQLITLYGRRVVYASQVQVQRGKADCGCFAIAFCVSLHFGEDPASLVYKQREMRKHIATCMVNGNYTPFPSAPKKSPHNELALDDN